MLTLGIDLSSMPQNTAACVVQWEDDTPVSAELHEDCGDERLRELITQVESVGIDAPFGWPLPFADAVADWTIEEWNEEIRDRLRFRQTDRFVQRRTGLHPLSVSADRIALPAMRAMALLRFFGVTNKLDGVARSGRPTFFEVYPAGSLAVWGLPHRGYKGKSAGERSLRQEILGVLLQARFPSLKGATDCTNSSDLLDSLVAALTAGLAARGRAVRPEPGTTDLARREGWIHLPGG